VYPFIEAEQFHLIPYVDGHELPAATR
jgi:hypothetical protein